MVSSDVRITGAVGAVGAVARQTGLRAVEIEMERTLRRRGCGTD